jgi:hypothetical protein
VSATFVIIGAMKSGTSTLREHLRTHPQVSMTARPESDYFIAERNWDRGPRWYERQFDMSRPVRGDSSPNYTKHPVFAGVPERMASVIPDARLIYLVRDPVSRLLSHYAHNLAHGRESRSLEEALADLDGNGYVDASRYHLQLGRFLACYPAERVLVLALDDLSSAPESTLRTVFSFIGADPGHRVADPARVYHRGETKTVPTALTRPLTRLPGGRLLRQAVGRFVEPPVPRPALAEPLRRRLEDALRPEVEALAPYAASDLSHWTYGAARP